MIQTVCSSSGGIVAVALQVEVSAVQTSSPAVLYLALTERGLQNEVQRGENSGRTLAHAHVVRTWVGPLTLAEDRHAEHRTLTLAAQWQRAELDVTAIVQDPRSGRVLQALRAEHCAAS